MAALIAISAMLLSAALGNYLGGTQWYARSGLYGMTNRLLTTNRRNRLATNIQRYYRGMQARRNAREYRNLRYWNWVRSPNFIGPSDDYIRPLDFFLGSRNQFRSGIREVDTDPTGTIQFTDPEPTGVNRGFRRFKRP